MSSNIVRFDPVRSILFSLLEATYQPFGPPLGHASRVLHFINGTDADVMISFDTVNDNIPVLAGGFNLYDLTSDQDENESFRYQMGSQLYIKYLSVPMKGSVYVVVVYGKGE